jgi:uncharacterized membrane protein
MVPSLSVAEAVKVKFAHCGITVLFVGLVKVTVGLISTITETTAEVVTNPLLSVARAVKEYVPAAAFVQVIV